MYTLRMELTRMYLVWQERITIMTAAKPADADSIGQINEPAKPGTSQQHEESPAEPAAPCGEMSDAMLIKMLKMTDPSNFLEKPIASGNDSL